MKQSEGTSSAQRINTYIDAQGQPYQVVLGPFEDEDWGPWTLREYLVALALGFAAMGLVAAVMFGAHLFAQAMRGFWR